MMRPLMIVGLLLLAVGAVHAQQRPELRAFWVDGFNDGYKTPEQCDQLLQRVRAAHMNAVFIQARKRADAYYASHYEPWAADDPQHFDALEYVCRKAHGMSPRVQVHAWINACAIGGDKRPSTLTKKHPEWFSLSDTGDRFDDESTKIDPGNPAAADWTYRVYMDVVRHYDVDGIHCDFIRYGGSGATAGHWGYNPVSVARYNAHYGATGQPAWDDPRWQQWRRDQVSNLVRRVYVNAVALKPKIIVSAATICWGAGPTAEKPYEMSSSYREVYAPWRDWLQEGILDIDCPMTYFTYPKRKQWWDDWAAFIKDHQFGRLSAMGVGIYLNDIPSSLEMIKSTRTPGADGRPAAGTVLFSYATTDSVNGQEEQYNEQFYSALAGPDVFAEDAPPPVMPWKDDPTTGNVMGVLIAGDNLTPLDGATVSLIPPGGEGTRKTQCDANGFFGFVGVPPGAYEVIVELGSARTDMARVNVTAGKTEMVLPGGKRSGIAGIGKLTNGAKTVLSGVMVTSGSDRLGDRFFVGDGIGKAVVQVNAPGLTPPTVAGDIVAVSGVIRHVNGMPVVDAAAVRQLGAVLIP